jgi:hypothetical protein
MERLRVVLADLADPPDTLSMVACDDVLTAEAIEIVRKRLLRRRKKCEATRRPSDVLGALRRLQNPQISGYRHQNAIILSEPFNGIPSAVRRASGPQAHKLVGAMFGSIPPPGLTSVLSAYGRAALERAASAGVRIAIVTRGRHFRDISASVNRCAPDLDSWVAPPAGLFVVDERRVLLREGALRMTAAHEFAHALDAALAQRPRSYYSFESEELRYYFATATGFVNEYAASGLDEYFAESMRAYVEVNDERCAWLPLTRQDLYLRDPRMFALIDRLFRSEFLATERRSAQRLRCRVLVTRD